MFKVTEYAALRSNWVNKKLVPCAIYLQDMERKTQLFKKRTAVIKEDHEHKEMEKLRQHFGGPDADRLAMTLKKLKSAYQEGKALLKRRHTRDIEVESLSNFSTDE